MRLSGVSWVLPGCFLGVSWFFGSWISEVGSWEVVVGKLEVGSLKFEDGRGNSELGTWRWGVAH